MEEISVKENMEETYAVKSVGGEGLMAKRLFGEEEERRLLGEEGGFGKVAKEAYQA